MIVVVAPYSPVELSSKPHLGAARKIELVIKALSRIAPVVLINTAHNSKNEPAKVCDMSLADGINFKMLTPRCHSSSSVGKLLNLFEVRSTWKTLLMLGNPKLVWLYNGYAFESLFCLLKPKNLNFKLVMEIEDWHLSRGRGLNPKPFIDFLTWHFAMQRVDYCYVINSTVDQIISKYNTPSKLLLGLVDEDLLDDTKINRVLDTTEIHAGYFGGLNPEKGADMILDLAKKLPENMHLHICGAGSLDKDFESLKLSRVNYYGRVSTSQLHQVMQKCHIIINPHTSIESMQNGVFPFKVIEGIASGSWMFSTKLPTTDFPGLLDSTIEFDGSTEDFLKKIQTTNFDGSSINRAVEVVRQNFSVETVSRFVSKNIYPEDIKKC